MREILRRQFQVLPTEFQPLFSAIIAGNIEELKSLGEGLNLQNKEGVFLLYLAYRHPAIRQYLVEKGVDINGNMRRARFEYRENNCWGLAILGGEDDLWPLVFAASEHLEFLQWLHKSGADMTVKDAYGKTALFRACELGKLDCVKFLCEIGLRPNEQDNLGNTPLHTALTGYESSAEVVQYLLDRGADSTLRNAKGETLFHSVMSMSSWARNFNFWQNLDIDAQDTDGNTALHKCWNEVLLPRTADAQPAFVWLTERGANINAKNHEKQTPLCYALSQFSPGGLSFVYTPVSFFAWLCERGAELEPSQANQLLRVLIEVFPTPARAPHSTTSFQDQPLHRALQIYCSNMEFANKIFVVILRNHAACLCTHGNQQDAVLIQNAAQAFNGNNLLISFLAARSELTEVYQNLLRENPNGKFIAQHLYKAILSNLDVVLSDFKAIFAQRHEVIKTEGAATTLFAIFSRMRELFNQNTICKFIVNCSDFLYPNIILGLILRLDLTFSFLDRSRETDLSYQTLPIKLMELADRCLKKHGEKAVDISKKFRAFSIALILLNREMKNQKSAISFLNLIALVFNIEVRNIQVPTNRLLEVKNFEATLQQLSLEERQTIVNGLVEITGNGNLKLPLEKSLGIANDQVPLISSQLARFQFAGPERLEKADKDQDEDSDQAMDEDEDDEDSDQVMNDRESPRPC